MSHDHFAYDRLKAKADETTDSYAEERETSDTVGPSTDFFEDDRVGDEAEVEDAVDNSNVHIPEQTRR